MKTKASKRILSIFMTVLMLMSSVSMMFAYAEDAQAQSEDTGHKVNFLTDFTPDTTAISKSAGIIKDSSNNVAGALSETSIKLDLNNAKNKKTDASGGDNKVYTGEFKDYPLENKIYTVEFSFRRTDYRGMDIYYFRGFSSMGAQGNKNYTSFANSNQGSPVGLLTVKNANKYKSNQTDFGSYWQYHSGLSSSVGGGNAITQATTNVAQSSGAYVHVRYVVTINITVCFSISFRNEQNGSHVIFTMPNICVKKSAAPTRAEKIVVFFGSFYHLFLRTYIFILFWNYLYYNSDTELCQYCFGI